jgi:RNA polymerase sigma factor (sigma-70 family)
MACCNGNIKGEFAMSPQHDEPERFDQIDTHWSLLRLAHQSSASLSGPARNSLALMYRGAIRSYIGALVSSPQDAEDLTQEVLVRLLSGGFHNANPQRGRFRDFLKVAVLNLVRQYWNQQKRRPQQAEIEELVDRASQAVEEQWLAGWRDTLLDQSWERLKQHEQTQQGSMAWTVLRLRADHPDDDSNQLAKRVSSALGRPVRSDTMRQHLYRARWRFAQLLIEEVARNVEPPTPEEVEEELIEIGLMEYVRDFLPPDWRKTGELKGES